MDGVKSGNIADGPTLSDEYKIISGYIVGPKVDLSGANLSDVNLTGMDLSEADLSGANLSNVNLTGINLTGVNLSNADLSGATLTNVASRGIEGTPSTLPEGYQSSGGFILGPDVNLSDKTLYNLNLSEVDLSSANLKGSFRLSFNRKSCFA